MVALGTALLQESRGLNYIPREDCPGTGGAWTCVPLPAKLLTRTCKHNFREARLPTQVGEVDIQYAANAALTARVLFPAAMAVCSGGIALNNTAHADLVLIYDCL